MNKNIQFNILHFCNSLVFFAPVAVLLRTTKGVTLSQFFMLQALLSVVIFLLEIPTGILADRLGYKKTILMSQIILFFARAMFLIADNIMYFVIEAVLEAFSCCFMSGTTDAYLYEQCRIRGNEEDFAEESAKADSWGTAGFIISTVGYPFIYHWMDLNGLVIATEIATMFSIVAALFMPEVKKKNWEKKEVIDISTLPKFSTILWKLVVLDTMIGITGLVINFLYAEKLNWVGISVEWMTSIILGYSALQLFVPKVIMFFRKRDKVSVYKIFALIGAICFIGIFIFHNYWCVVFMMLAPFTLKIIETIQYKYENTYIDELGQMQNRATLLSIINMGNNLFGVIFLLMSAVISSEQGNVVFLFAGMLLFIAALFGCRIIRKISLYKNDI